MTNTKKIHYILSTLMISSLLFIGCDNTTSLTHSLEKDSSNQKSPNHQLSFDLSSSTETIYTIASRVGNSGTGKDISARGKIYILGDNSKIYYYDSPTNDWVREPGGGTGKRISATSDNLLLCGSNNKIYYKPINSSTDWTFLQGDDDSKCRDIAGQRNTSGIVQGGVAVVGRNYSTYLWDGVSWQKYTDDYTPNRSFDKAFDIATSNDDMLAIRAFTYDEGSGISDYRDILIKSKNFSGIWNSIIDYPKQSWDIGYAPNNDLWYVNPNGDIINYTTNTKYSISNRTADRISIANNGNVYFIDRNNHAIYKLNI